ncbi:MAG: PEGA domain-containing protein [Terriglobia bacterium]|jgi:hypothetical protein
MRWRKLEFLILVILLSSAVALTAKDTSEYPLRVELLDNTWQWYRPYPYRDPGNIVYTVTGRGNIGDGSTKHAFDFNYECFTHARVDLRGQFYPGKWKKPQHELEILIPDIGKDGKYKACEVRTTVREGVYVWSHGSLVEISQDNYPGWKAEQDAPKAPQPQEQTAAVSKLSVTSNPDSADIDVDGDFMGTTPSVLQLNVGEHTITLRKAGFKLWERKMKVVTGEIKLNADLEPENPK